MRGGRRDYYRVGFWEVSDWSCSTRSARVVSLVFVSSGSVLNRIHIRCEWEPAMQALLQNLRFSLRAMRRKPGNVRIGDHPDRTRGQSAPLALFFPKLRDAGL